MHGLEPSLSIAELVQEHAGPEKETLRTVDKEIQQGQRDPLGRDKKHLEEVQETKVTKVAWHTIKDAGTTQPSLVPLKSLQLLLRKNLAACYKVSN